MNVADLNGVALDYWVARSLHDFVREIYFTDSGETVSIRGNDRGRPWDGRFTPSTSWEAAGAVLERAQRLEVRERTDSGAARRIASRSFWAAIEPWRDEATRCGWRCCGRSSQAALAITWTTCCTNHKR